MRVSTSILSLAVAGLALSGCAGATSGAVPAGSYVPSPAIHAAASPIKLSPTKLNFTTAPTLKLKISEAKYTGTFTLTMNPGGIVKLSKSSVKGPNATVTVTALNAGKTTITATDKSKNAKSIPVTVTQGVIIIQ